MVLLSRFSCDFKVNDNISRVTLNHYNLDGFIVIAAVWCMAVIKVDPGCFKGVSSSSWCYGQIKHVEYYLKS